MIVGSTVGLGLGMGIVAGSGRKIRPARTVAPKATGAPTKVTTAKNSELKIILTIRQSSLMAGSSFARAPRGVGAGTRRRPLFEGSESSST